MIFLGLVSENGKLLFMRDEGHESFSEEVNTHYAGFFFKLCHPGSVITTRGFWFTFGPEIQDNGMW